MSLCALRKAIMQTDLLRLLDNNRTILNDDIQLGESLCDLQADMTTASANIDNETVLGDASPVISCPTAIALSVP